MSRKICWNNRNQSVSENYLNTHGTLCRIVIKRLNSKTPILDLKLIGRLYDIVFIIFPAQQLINTACNEFRNSTKDRD